MLLTFKPVLFLSKFSIVVVLVNTNYKWNFKNIVITTKTAPSSINAAVIKKSENQWTLWILVYFKKKNFFLILSS